MDNFSKKYVDEQINDVRNNGFLDYRTDALPTWCPGCGYFGITQAVVEACNELKIKNEDICAVSGIGCAGRYPFFMDVYGFHTIHGRSVPVASGIKLSREELTVIAVAGDGDIMGIGGGHLPHISRKNIPDLSAGDFPLFTTISNNPSQSNNPFFQFFIPGMPATDTDTIFIFIRT